MSKKLMQVLISISVFATLTIAQDSAGVHQLRYGLGFGVGTINSTEFNNYVDSFAEETSSRTTRSLDGLSFSPRIFIGYRVNALIFCLSGETAVTQKIAYNSNRGLTFYFRRYTAGVESNYLFRPASKFSLMAGGGILYHYLYIESGDNIDFSANTIGYRLQFGANIIISRSGSFTIQPLLFLDYAKGKDKGMDLDYSSVHIRLNLIFRKNFL